MSLATIVWGLTGAMLVGLTLAGVGLSEHNWWMLAGGLALCGGGAVLIMVIAAVMNSDV